MMPAVIEQITQSKFVCSACGSGRDCDCAALVVTNRGVA
jgi:hypothetical protein